LPAEVIASAYYVDFDSPQWRNLPEIIREQRPCRYEESLEWSVGPPNRSRVGGVALSVTILRANRVLRRSDG